MERGAWSIEHGAWSMELGAWSMDMYNEAWSMEHAAWSCMRIGCTSCGCCLEWEDSDRCETNKSRKSRVEELKLKATLIFVHCTDLNQHLRIEML